MNKTEFIKELEIKTNYSPEQCTVINDVLENHFILRKKNKPKVVAELSERLAVGNAEAEKIYGQVMEIINAQIKTAKRRPFGDPSKRKQN